ncbi:hypothetical protein IQ251_13450 [Saccharopolyspora sp. HNM0983]|uniref:DUF1440 domain-containing protein n=1 Tax=Saccharopolyspora montiporae TaxID=2781240 RepID=A0A929BD72_9PSEU|nr:hypothetical protein [Saccharopolyspora sp. HNM0983]MBE9375453.1 hypothetical protein [Saccharopolyspora sp. HNM0983]
MRRLARGVLAGAAGTTALNLATYADMAVRARPASTTPDTTVRRTEELTGVVLPGADEAARANRRSGSGALLGLVTGLASGAAYGLLRPALGAAPLPVLGAVAGLIANAGSVAPMATLGVTDPRTWTAESWLSDLLPHAAFGLATAVAFEQLRPR